MKKADSIYTKINKLTPFNYEPYRGRALIKINEEEYNDAITILNHYLKIKPKHPGALFLKAMTLSIKNKEENIQEKLKKILEIKPLHKPSLSILIENYNEDNKHKKSIKILKQKLKKYSNSVLIYELLGDTYYNYTDDYEMALKYYKKVLQIDKNRTYIYYKLSDVMEDLDQPEKSKFYEDLAEKLNPIYDEDIQNQFTQDQNKIFHSIKSGNPINNIFELYQNSNRRRKRR